MDSRPAERRSVTVCLGTGCLAKGAAAVLRRFREEAGQAGLDGVAFETRLSGCHGLCDQGPLVLIRPDGLFYVNVTEAEVPRIVRETLVLGKPVEDLLYTHPVTGAKSRSHEEIPFYSRQRRELLRLNGTIDPTSLDEYIAAGGYSALAKALGRMSPDEIIVEVERAGLRGRGGGGFPTARKWKSCREARGDVKYVIGNGDEGDPGAFMDRSLMEDNPHLVLEGLIIGAYAIGSSQGYIYVRNEYPLAVERLGIAMRQARERNLLGGNILGSGFSFDVKINRGGGAFVCGESTALMASLEGRVGEPRVKYIHTAEAGLFGKPTNLNNVETWANVPRIVLEGGAKFAEVGTAGSKGTKVFSLVGSVRNTGLVEVPMGMTLREIVFDIGGGLKDGGRFKAVQTGGPSGGCIPAEFLDTPVDFDELTKLGSMMGSGGMIVMGEDTCMVDVAKYFMTFLKEESCGKCTACREGLAQTLALLEKITRGEGEPADIGRLEDLCVLMDYALCGLGNTASNPVRSTLRYFRDEYIAHTRDKKCPAKVCKGLFHYRIVEERCKACGLCARACPAGAIEGKKKELHRIIKEKCTSCGLCVEACEFEAIVKV
jgi:NADH-quinone oxidoreductase subunit F